MAPLHSTLAAAGALLLAGGSCAVVGWPCKAVAPDSISQAEVKADRQHRVQAPGSKIAHMTTAKARMAETYRARQCRCARANNETVKEKQKSEQRMWGARPWTTTPDMSLGIARKAMRGYHAYPSLLLMGVFARPRAQA